MNTTKRRVGKNGTRRVRHRARFKDLKRQEESGLAPQDPDQDGQNADSSMLDESERCLESRVPLVLLQQDEENNVHQPAEDEPPAKMTMTLQTQQIRHAMAEIRKLYADRVAPILSRPLSTLPMTVQEFCYYVVLRTHKSRRVTATSD